MNRYNVTIQRTVDYEIEVIAENEEQAEEQAEELFNTYEIKGSEMYSSNNNDIELIEENVEVEEY